MSRILLLLEHKENRRLMSEWLAIRHEVILPDSSMGKQDSALLCSQSFDLGILDGPTLDRLWREVQEQREAEYPVFLPFLLITSRSDVGMATRHLWQNMDDLITKPIEKVELQARVEILLRSRSLSQQLKATNEDLQSEIAERQRIELALAKSEAKFRALVQNSSDVIRVINTDGTVTYASPSSRNVLGYYPAELEGTNAFDFVHPDDFYNAITPFKATVTHPGKTQVSEYRFRHQDGSWRYLESKSNFSRTDKSLDGIVVNSRDITERKQAQEDIIRALKKERELNELKNRFVSMVSHETRNPLNTISVITQLLERESDKLTSEKKQEFFQRIKASIKKLTDLLEDVLEIGRAESGKLKFNPAPLELEKFCRELVGEVQLGTRNHKIVFVTQDQSTTANVDEKLLQQILTNLLSNAIKYSHPDGTVYLNLAYQDGEAVFQIKDKGIGIPKEDQERVFESFHRASNVNKIPGTGLGLAIVKKCVELHDGRIAVASEVGMGTTFTVKLPIARVES